MTAVRITAAKARQLGLPGIPKTTTKKGRTRKTAPGPYLTVCVLCGTEFRTRASEDRHVTETQHPRYALILDPDRPVSPDAEHRRPNTRTGGATTEGGTP